MRKGKANKRHKARARTAIYQAMIVEDYTVHLVTRCAAQANEARATEAAAAKADRATKRKEAIEQGLNLEELGL